MCFTCSALCSFDLDDESYRTGTSYLGGALYGGTAGYAIGGLYGAGVGYEGEISYPDGAL